MTVFDKFSESNYSENAFKWILDLVDHRFSVQNKDNVNINERKRNKKLTKNLVHDLAFFQCFKLMPKFEEI